ncbi:glutamyl-tRNA reductase [Flexibacter flexilis DSM 6793]|uniref:Glutamyl-tRNA reductase n=1 Tax=Flexibacter flexilis DSM 6793 TaxID=927664 RepID=A0A1I1LBF1_9BACT|nr:glutamyl-tRNA reductase [Flexibacter flexilis]SFC70316.1 glutamyl-tRNA reductase [Flexibacter flexilis DSM 6793]
MYYHFKATILSYKTASVELRERVALNEDDCKMLLQQLRDIIDVTDLFILSTCNRTEIYYSAPQDYTHEILTMLATHKGVSYSEIASCFVSITDHRQAAQHLFEVAIGLESQVVGDMQIINQVKHAYQWCADADLAGPFLHRLLHTIFFANKKVVQETNFRDGAASVSYAAMELVEELTADIAQPRVLVVGVGEIGADVCRNLANTRIKNVTICNRTQSKAEELAAECEMRVAPFEQLWEEIAAADVIISSVARNEPLISKEEVKALNSLSYKYFLDLSMPRSVAADVEEVAGALVYNIDHINNRATEALERRLAAIPKVKSIVNDAMAEFSDWTKEMEVSPTINKLKNALEQIRQEEMARYMKQLSEDDVKLMDKITKGMMQKIIKLPVLQLKAACKRGEADTLIDVLNDLFNLEAHSDTVSH